MISKINIHSNMTHSSPFQVSRFQNDIKGKLVLTANQWNAWVARKHTSDGFPSLNFHSPTISSLAAHHQPVSSFGLRCSEASVSGTKPFRQLWCHAELPPIADHVVSQPGTSAWSPPILPSCERWIPLAAVHKELGLHLCWLGEGIGTSRNFTAAQTEAWGHFASCSDWTD